MKARLVNFIHLDDSVKVVLIFFFNQGTCNRMARFAVATHFLIWKMSTITTVQYMHLNLAFFPFSLMFFANNTLNLRRKTAETEVGG